MKMSQIIQDFAGDYIEMGGTIEQKQSYLNAACSAWNIANLPKQKRKKALENFFNAYRNANPTEEDISNVEHDMELLVKEKIRLFPKIKQTIANAQIHQEGGQYKILVASLRHK